MVICISGTGWRVEMSKLKGAFLAASDSIEFDSKDNYKLAGCKNPIIKKRTAEF